MTTTRIPLPSWAGCSALHEDQANLLDPAKLAQIGSVLAKQFTSAFKQAVAPKDAGVGAGALTSSPAEVNSALEVQPRGEH